MIRVLDNETFEQSQKIIMATTLVQAELAKAMAKHGPMHSPHEAFGVIYEEFMIEFAEEMKANDFEKQKIEMVQVAAMAMRALIDVY